MSAWKVNLNRPPKIRMRDSKSGQAQESSPRAPVSLRDRINVYFGLFRATIDVIECLISEKSNSREILTCYVLD